MGTVYIHTIRCIRRCRESLGYRFSFKLSQGLLGASLAIYKRRFKLFLFIDTIVGLINYLKIELIGRDLRKRYAFRNDMSKVYGSLLCSNVRLPFIVG